jgi:hypothetical protein
MATQYPSKIDDNASLPQVVDTASIFSADVYNRLRNAIIAIETELGVKPSGIDTTVKHRFEVLEDAFGNIQIIDLAGDLGGSHTSPQVIGLRGIPISSTAPTSGQVLAYNGSAWTPIPPDIALGAFQADGDLSGSNITQTVIGLQNRSVSGTLPNDGYILTWSDMNNAWEPQAAPVGFSAGGDLSGTESSQTVIKLQNRSVLSTAPDDGYILTWSDMDNAWGPAAPPVSFIADTELSFASGLISTSSSTYIRVGARSLMLQNYPATIGSLTRVITFYAFVDKTPGATSVDIRLYDTENNIEIAGTAMTSNVNYNIDLSVTEPTLGVGSTPGQLIDTSDSYYELQMKMTGGTVSDAVFCTNSYIVIRYV